MRILRYDVAVILLSLSIFLLFSVYGCSRGSALGYLLVEDQTGRSIYSLDEERTLEIHGPSGISVVRIEDGAAWFVSSDCPDDLCIEMGPVVDPGAWAACLPNRVFIAVEGAIPGEAPDDN